MVKYGKLYRELKIKEFSPYYIDYKKLKQKIKQIKQKINSLSIANSLTKSTTNILKNNLRISLEGDEYNPNISKLSIHDDKYGEQLTDFKKTLDQEFEKCFKFFQKIKKQLYTKLNGHLYTQANYATYNIEDIIKEINNLRITIYLAKCLNAFINDNMMAIKKILKKFDKNFYLYFGNFGPKYILDNLCKENSDLEYLLQFKIIDEACCIIEDNIKLLKENYEELNSNNNNNNIPQENDNFHTKFNEILEYLKDIDELIYFKIQYKEWFYFIKQNSVMKKQSDLYKNLLFNPVLFSPFHKDDIMNKFLSRKEQIKEVEDIQAPLSFSNRINIAIILIQTFFYNTLISSIYPLQFIYILDLEDKKNEYHNLTEYSFLIISSTYICACFTILIYNLFGTQRIKLSYIISNLLYLIGSMFYIISYNDRQSINYVFGFLITARIFIGFGANPLMGKNYILSYTSKYYLPLISKLYVIIQILGHSFGPFFVFIFIAVNNEEKAAPEIIPNIFYSKYNCIGWYGLVGAIILIAFNLIFFTSPSSAKFEKSKLKGHNHHDEELNKKNENFLSDDDDNEKNKIFYQQQKEMIDKSNDLIEEEKEEEDNDDDNNIITTKTNSKIKINVENNKSNEKEKESMNNLKKTLSLVPNKVNIENIEVDVNSNNNENIYNPNIDILNEGNRIERFMSEDAEHGTFSNVNMIPRAIEDLIRKEKKKFSYLNRNLIIILIILFFCNLLKENFIAYSSYYLYLRNKDNDRLEIFLPKFLCLFISISYLLELISVFFILPLYKMNTIIKKFLVILMCLTILLMIPLLFDIKLYLYFIIVSFVILISAIIEVFSSSYLSYLTPPDWKYSHINASSLPFYIMNFGKLTGCLICFTSFAEKQFVHSINNFCILIITIIGYGISGFYILKSKNFRIKAICRIMRKTELDSFNIY